MPLAHSGRRRARCGLALDRAEDLTAALSAADVAALRRRVADARARLTVEAQIGRIAQLYRELPADQSWAIPEATRRAPSLGNHARARHVGAGSGEPMTNAEVARHERALV